MKFSIIMAAKQSMPFIMSSVESFKRQSYKKKELIIVYDKSNDQTENYLKNIKEKNIKIYLCNKGLYQSLNYGILKSTGNIVGTLHSDDAFTSESILEKVSKVFQNKKCGICYGNVLYSEKNNLNLIKREWKKIALNKKYSLPPHTGTFFKKDLINKPYYKSLYNISGDTEFLLRLFNVKGIKKSYINNELTIMREGGLSSSYKYIFTKLFEDFIVFRKFNLTSLDVIKKIFSKFNQINFIKKRKNNIFIKKIENLSKIKFVDPKDVLEKEKFILCAFNLAYIAFNYKHDLRNHLSIFWPDGVFSIFLNQKKVAGRNFFNNFLKYLKINKKNSILILGNFPKISEKWLKSKIKNKILHQNLPYGEMSKLYSKINRINFKKNQIVVITLPTPKQEIIANYISSKNINCKIICLGGSLNMLSGHEMPAPEIMNKFYLEWLWRLRYDTLRRILRLIISFFYFIVSFFSGKTKYLY